MYTIVAYANCKYNDFLLDQRKEVKKTQNTQTVRVSAVRAVVNNIVPKNSYNCELWYNPRKFFKIKGARR